MPSVILIDDEDRENEGDVMIAAEKVTPEAITFMARYACGLICLSLAEERVKAACAERKIEAAGFHTMDDQN